MNKRNYNIFKISFISVSIVAFIVLILAGRNFFRLNKIVIKSDFDVNKEKLVKFLEISPNKIIFTYNTGNMKRKLAKLDYLRSFNVYKRYPDSIVIKVEIKNYAVKVLGESGVLYLADDSGKIFNEPQYDFSRNPTLIFSGNTLFKAGDGIPEKYLPMLKELSFISRYFRNTYSSISQIEVIESKRNNIYYKIYFKTMKNYIYLKNSINVDAINKGLTACLYLDGENIEGRGLYFNKNTYELL